MTDFTDVKVALRNQDSEDIKNIVAAYLQTEDGSVERVLSQLFYLTAHEDIGTGEPLGIIYMDSVRDLLTLYESADADPSGLLNTAIEYFCTLRLREFDKSLTTLQPEDMGQILMVEDLSKHIRAGHRDKALRQTTNLLWTMDNVFYLVEILTELAACTDNEESLPLVLSGVVLKTTDFVTSAQRNPLVFLLTDYLTLQNFTDTSVPSTDGATPGSFDDFYTAVIDSKDVFTDGLIYLTYAHQVWESVRMKADSIQPLIIQSLQSRFGEPDRRDEIQVKPAEGDSDSRIRRGRKRVGNIVSSSCRSDFRTSLP